MSVKSQLMQSLEKLHGKLREACYSVSMILSVLGFSLWGWFLVSVPCGQRKCLIDMGGGFSWGGVEGWGEKTYNCS